MKDITTLYSAHGMGNLLFNAGTINAESYIKMLKEHMDIPNYSIYYYIQTILLGIRVLQRNCIIFRRIESLKHL